MHVLISGGTGFIGTAVIKALLLQKNITCTVITRSPQKCMALFNHAVQAITYEGLTGAHPTYDALIHLAGENIAEGMWTDAKKKRILSSRTEPTQTLLKALKNQPLKVVISASAVGLYPATADPVDENTPAGSDFLATVVQAWEKEVQKFKSFVPRVVILRFPMVLGHEKGAFPALFKLFSMQMGAIFGTGSQWMSWIHLDDLVHMILKALYEGEGIYNTVAQPCLSHTFSKTLARHTHCLLTPKIPQALLSPFLGEKAALLLENKKVTSLGPPLVPLHYPDMDHALQDLCEKSLFYYFYHAQTVDAPLEKVFAFFSQTAHLPKITPEKFHFTFTNPSMEPLGLHSLLDYQLTVKGVRMKGQTHITAWEPPFQFQDTQTKGPFGFWEHTHHFVSISPDQTRICDTIRYQLPCRPFSAFAHPFVKKDLEQLFAYRSKAITRFFPPVHAP